MAGFYAGLVAINTLLHQTFWITKVLKTLIVEWQGYQKEKGGANCPPFFSNRRFPITENQLLTNQFLQTRLSGALLIIETRSRVEFRPTIRKKVICSSVV